MFFGVLNLLAALTLLGGEGKLDKKAQAEQLLRETMARADSLPWSERVQRLERAVGLDRKLATGYFELARTRMEHDTIADRMRAAEALERAVRLNPKNADFHYAFAMLHLRRGMDNSAAREFRKTIDLNPNDPRPHHQLGLLAEENMLHYRDMFNFTGGGVLDLRGFADDDYVEAQTRFEAALAADPHYAETYYRLALLYYEGGRLEAMTALLRQAVRLGIANLDHYLFLGLAYHELGDDEAARRSYETALSMMSAPDRKLFESLLTVLPPDSLAAYQRVDSLQRTNQERKFWAARDPLYLTPTNERLMEHYGRVAYANLRYSFPFRHVEGWKTDRGKTLIRFGRPRRHYKSRADLGSSPITGHMQLNPSREVWDYGDFQLVYEDRFLNRNYAFAWGFLPENDSKNVFDRLIASTPERYDYFHGSVPLSLPHLIAQFRGRGDSTQLELYYGISEAQVQPGAVGRQSARFLLERGLFVFDPEWHPCFEKRESRVLDAPTSEDSSNLVIDRLSFSLPAGHYAYALELRDRISLHSGSARATFTVEDLSGDSLKISSLVLASQVTERGGANTTGLYTKDGVDVIPVLVNRFPIRRPVYIYYEVYNLQTDADGLCRYRVDSRIEPVVEKSAFLAGAIRGIGRLLGVNPQRTAITSSFESGSVNRNEILYHAIEMADARPGRYELTLTLQDLRSGQRVSRQAQVEIVKDEQKP